MRDDDPYRLGGDEEAQRDRYRELLEELRTVLPGVQVLLAFLLTVPFSQRFTELDDLGRDVFAAVVLGVALAIVSFLTPAAYHRMGDREDRAERLKVSVRMAMLGMTLLAASVSAVVFVVVRFVYGDTQVGAVFGGGVALIIAILWYLAPAVRAKKRHRRRAE